MATREDIRDRAGNSLGILPLNQSLSAQDKTRVESAYREVYKDLKQRGLAPWAYEGDVADEYVPHVVALTADNCISSGSYGVSEERFARITVAADKAIREIRALVRGPYLTRECPRDF